MRTELQTDMFTYDQPGQNTDIRGILRYDNAPAAGFPGDPASDDPGPGVPGLSDVDGMTALVALTPEPAPEATRAYPVTVSFQYTDDGQFLGFMNSTSWDPLAGSTLMAVLGNPTGFAPEGVSAPNDDQLLATEDSIQVVDIRVDNLDDGDHPFHLHGHRPWIMGSGEGRYVGQALDTTNPLRRDTVLIPAYSWLVLRFVTDNPGVWAFHCHLAWHMSAGLLMQFVSQPSALARMEVPRDVVAQCRVQY
ncbi:hypothetical protein BV25DRAFT_374174 [Artomyces pyxidatus]|uniref:Uncharacterized protein n=1 Tax=Artomyces pyxidatus TaxID=48021 RepID=A0ACB8T635_9AGAM|nr:hypothetical protein BV25DRAFT_374174 [Artomyces pyxidatus]